MPQHVDVASPQQTSPCIASALVKIQGCGASSEPHLYSSKRHGFSGDRRYSEHIGQGMMHAQTQPFTVNASSSTFETVTRTVNGTGHTGPSAVSYTHLTLPTNREV